MSRVHLALVDQGDVLRGLGPEAFERLARSSTPGSREHRGLVMIISTLARHCATTCVPPSAQIDLVAGIETAQLWVRGLATESDVGKSRRNCFGAVSAIEEMTASAVKKAQAHLSAGAPTPLDPHADHVVERYARLTAHFTTSAVCHALDAIEKPEVALEVLGDIEGARAYQGAGLGAARHPAFRNAAFNQAEWETSRAPGARTESLALQVFHEYLGGRWRTHADAERQKNSAFIAWVLSGKTPGAPGTG